ncbi:MAG: IS3 family transposase [Dactylosporangium sp.]|nr:IS3 family transposase [Dactylosporangium sp.]
MSAATGRPYPVEMVCRWFGVARSTYYAWCKGHRRGGGKRGPKTPVSDEKLVAQIRDVIRSNPFHGEGYRKIRARLGLRVSGKRVLRLMRENGLLAPVRRVHAHGRRAHDGTIQCDHPNRLWGTDATRFYTEEDGWCWFFGAIDHHAEDIVGWHVAQVGDRFAAAEPVRMGVRREFGVSGRDVARGLILRHDHGPQYMSRDFRQEMAFYGIQLSPAFVGEPEGNGIIERFMRTLKEQCVYIHRFRNLEHAREVIGRFIALYNGSWILQRHGYRTPDQVRSDFLRKEVA